ncbi:MAG: MotA/TolQ/ExbB proton channel family protein [Calditrichaeota bacterium]|nr:MotA/TolQ/ExbB proton channel family protein [Calditrichota bacterium]MCB9367945.1 MotA/TolQ/ExbB proton channel family protein [Calditrichota bacterium]
MKQGTFTIITLLAALVLSFVFYFAILPVMDKGVEETPLIHQISLAGPIVPILITLTLMLITFVAERVITLNRARGARPLPVYFSEFTKAVREGKYDQAIQVSDKQRGSAAAVLKAGAEQWVRVEADKSMHGEKKISDTQRAINEARLLEVPFLERNLIALSTIASIATMTGLLGTTVGMIRAFAAMSTQGAPNAAELARGISEALVNTALGLFAAILGIVAYNFFVNKVDQFNYEIDEAAYLMVEILKDKE